MLSQVKAGVQDHVLSRLRLSIGEAARVTGVTVRQLGYWTEKGLVRALGTSGRKRYDFRALEHIALIKGALNQGFSLEEAAAEAAAVLKPKPLAAAEARTVILDHLEELEQLVASVRRWLNEAAAQQLAGTSAQLLRPNLRALLDEEPRKRTSADELARQLSQTRDRVRAALESLAADATRKTEQVG